jgi:type IX secretion system PorP/SprF family membrane protein
MKKLAYIFFILLVNYKLQNEKCFAQAYQFTQFYAAPTFLNPAFAGAGTCERATTNYRVQWPSIPGAFRTYLFAFDHGFPQKKSGIGFLFSNDKAGSGNLRSTSVSLQYSYQLVLSRKWMFNSGLEAGYVSRNYDFNKYIFGDQIAYGTAASVDQPIYEHNHYIDLSSGLVLYSEKTWLGFSARHLNTPDQGLVDGKSPLPVLYSINTGWTIPVKHYGEKGKTLTYIKPAINYRAEKKFDQLDLGFYYTYSDLTLGVWYRGIPLFKSYKPGYQNNDALAFLAGVTAGRFKFGYSYDLTISRLAGSTGGAHEISLSYQFCKRSLKSAIPCPKF